MDLSEISYEFRFFPPLIHVYARLDIVMVIKIQVAVFWIAASYNGVVEYPCFGEPCSIHHHDSSYFLKMWVFMSFILFIYHEVECHYCLTRFVLHLARINGMNVSMFLKKVAFCNIIFCLCTDKTGDQD
jgi:hypothetical protein